MTTASFMAFLLALTAIYKPAKTMTGVGGGIQAGLIAAEKLFDFLDKESEIVDAPDAVELQRVPMEVKLDHISFAYNDKDGNVLHDVSLAIKPGTICAFAGPSGGGKSTIFNLLDRFYDPQQGNIFINGENIRNFTLASLRSNIAVVSQDVFLFGGTIADNIKYGTPDATPEQIREAAIAANAHEFIMGFPEQYDNQVGERGGLLSGGQKQRIAIARAILKDAPILLLDEATSALDSHSEQKIQSALKTLMRGRTTFVIAHRLATILDADIICVIKDGRIIEKGTDAELYKLGGEYRKLKDIQFSESGKESLMASSIF
jgi:ABC-type multidrug transport system fused ATPase/permease subunit